jgi:hypothetical protein
MASSIRIASSSSRPATRHSVLGPATFWRSRQRTRRVGSSSGRTGTRHRRGRLSRTGSPRPLSRVAVGGRLSDRTRTASLVPLMDTSRQRVAVALSLNAGARRAHIAFGTRSLLVRTNSAPAGWSDASHQAVSGRVGPAGRASPARPSARRVILSRGGSLRASRKAGSACHTGRRDRFLIDGRLPVPRPCAESNDWRRSRRSSTGLPPGSRHATRRPRASSSV